MAGGLIPVILMMMTIGGGEMGGVGLLDRNHHHLEEGEGDMMIITTIGGGAENAVEATAGSMVETDGIVMIIIAKIIIAMTSTTIISSSSRPWSAIIPRVGNMPRKCLHNQQRLHQQLKQLQRRPGPRSSSRNLPGVDHRQAIAAAAEVETVVARERRRAGRNEGGEGEAAIGGEHQDPDPLADRGPGPDPTTAPTMATGSEAAAANPERPRRRTAVPSRHHHHHRPMIRPIGTIPSVISRVDREPWWPIAIVSSRMWDLAPLAVWWNASTLSKVTPTPPPDKRRTG